MCFLQEFGGFCTFQGFLFPIEKPFEKHLKKKRKENKCCSLLRFENLPIDLDQTSGFGLFFGFKC